jgi:hypothetical protein
VKSVIRNKAKKQIYDVSMQYDFDEVLYGSALCKYAEGLHEFTNEYLIFLTISHKFSNS